MKSDGVLKGEEHVKEDGMKWERDGCGMSIGFDGLVIESEGRVKKDWNDEEISE